MPNPFEKKKSDDSNRREPEQRGLSHTAWKALFNIDTVPIANRDIQLTAPSAKDVFGNHPLDPLAIRPSGTDHHTIRPVVDIPKLFERVVARDLTPPVPGKLGVLRASRWNIPLPPKPETSRPPITELLPAMRVFEEGIGAIYEKYKQQALKCIKEDARTLVALVREMEKIANDRLLGYMSIKEEAKKTFAMDPNPNKRWKLAEERISMNEMNKRLIAINAIIDRLKDELSVNEKESPDLQYTRIKLEKCALITSQVAVNIIIREEASSPHRNEEKIHENISEVVRRFMPSLQSASEKAFLEELAEATVKEAQRKSEVSLIVNPPEESPTDGWTRLG